MFAGAGAVSFIMWTLQRKKRRDEDAAAARKKEAIPVGDLAAWVQETAKVEEQAGNGDDVEKIKRDPKKVRYTGINMTGKDGPVELEVPDVPYELPGTVLRHEFEG